MIRALVAGVVLVAPTFALADVLEVQPVTDDVWAIVGPLEQRSPENLANNATFGLVATREGAVLIDPGGSWQGAEMLHAAVRAVTDHRARADDHMVALAQFLCDGLDGTELAAYSDVTFETDYGA
jgi:hypothetical protein